MSDRLQSFDREESLYEHPHRAWVCGRIAAGEAACQAGPRGNQCRETDSPCRPRRSMRSQRARLSAVVALIALGAAAIALLGPWQAKLLSPGPLTAKHEELACADCHVNAGKNPLSWSWGALDNSQRCLDCHTEKRDRWPEAVFAAHGLPARLLESPAGRSRSQLPFASPATGAKLRCGMCHMEHQGQQADRRVMKDQRCQSCHVQPFKGFTSGHPKFPANYPHHGKTPLAFSHQQHQKHFGGLKKTFDCQTCHLPDKTGARMLTRPFAQSCDTACHTHTKDVDQTRTVTVIQLPALPLRKWPHRAKSIKMALKKKPVPWLTLLPVEQQALARLQRALAPHAKLSRKEGKRIMATQRPAAQAVADEIERGLTRLVAESKLAGLSTAAQAALARWHSKGSAPAKLPAGWAVARRRLTYQRQGHADPVFKALLDRFAASPAQLKRLNGDQAVSNKTTTGCLKCHARVAESGTVTLQWDVRPAAPRPFSRFVHKAHLDQSCASCHQLKTAASDPEFGALQQSTCESCHQPGKKAGSGCLTCHNYHVQSPGVWR